MIAIHHPIVWKGSKLPLSAAPYSRPESGVVLKEMTRNPTFGLRLPELRLFLPWLDGGRHGER